MEPPPPPPFGPPRALPDAIGRDAAHPENDPVAGHRRVVAATQAQPGDVGAWIERAETAASTEERIFCLSQVNRLDPSHPTGKAWMYEALWGELKRDSFLAYLEETEHIYYVRSSDFISLAISKDRSRTETYPPAESSAIGRARRRLGWAILGLSLSGVGTLILAPLAIRSSIRILRASGDRADRVRAGIIIALALVLLAPALLLTWVLFIHL